MSVLTEFQKWHESNCDGDWEHGYGIKIETLDNPGWSVTIDLTGTELETRPFPRVEDLNTESAWIICWVEGMKFSGCGGPEKLEPILQMFLNWARQDDPAGRNTV